MQESPYISMVSRIARFRYISVISYQGYPIQYYPTILADIGADVTDIAHIVDIADIDYKKHEQILIRYRDFKHAYSTCLSSLQFNCPS